MSNAQPTTLNARRIGDSGFGPTNLPAKRRTQNPTRPGSLDSTGPKRRQWIDPRGSPGRHIPTDERDTHERDEHGGERHRIARGHAEQEAAERTRRRPGRDRAEDHASSRQDQRLTNDAALDVTRRRA